MQASAILLLIAAIADMADGAVARLIKASSEFGVQFDSLADVVSFGVAPALFVIRSLTRTGPMELPRWLLFLVVFGCIVYALCGVLRLARYNVQTKKLQEMDEKARAEAKGHFTGLPIPAAASAAISSALFLISPTAEAYFPFSISVRAAILAIVLLILGYFMISRWKFPSVKALHFRVPSIYLVFATGLFAAFVLFAIMDYFSEVYFALTWLYILIAWALSIIRKIAGKRSRVLSDFEPEGEEGDNDE